jgi:erythronate-4-phosphate dehydrogenase
MKIIVDDQIPLVDELFAGHQLVKKPGNSICREDLLDAQMLWVRTVTPVNAELLSETAVRFVGAATAGYDHMDTEWLQNHDIGWAYAPGANAGAVAEYVLCAIAALRTQGHLLGKSLRAGVIGAGHVGQLVVDYLLQAGFEVIINDPPRHLFERDFSSTALNNFRDLDLLCLHPSLTFRGAHPSHHLLSDSFLSRQKKGMVLLNASRGAVLDTQVLLQQPHLLLCLDVWENEPNINLDLLRQAVIATPHIAAYSIQAKHRASELLYQEAQQFFTLPDRNIIAAQAGHQPLAQDWETRALEIFDPLQYTEKMREELLKNEAEAAEKFLELRKNYQWRKSLLS